MAEIAKKHTNRLEELKKSVEEWQKYFSENIKRYDEFTSFVCKSSLDDLEAASLAERGMPTLEFNILEAYISSQLGQFAKQQPSVTVRAADGVPSSLLTKKFIETIDVIEAHYRFLFSDYMNDMVQYNVLADILRGGYSVIKIYTDYINEKSFDQNIYLERAFNPTLCAFDVLARESHKGDGRFCAEIYPMTEEDFKRQFGSKIIEGMSFTKSLAGFSWSFQNDNEKIILVCDYYEKQFRNEIIVKLTNGHVVSKKNYEKFLMAWNESGIIEQPPMVVKERKTKIEKIIRYRFCESSLLDVSETDYKHLPLIFASGNSVNIKDGASYVEITRPLTYHAKGIQRLKNFAGQSLANELENTVQHKFVAAVESIPLTQMDAYKNVQKADTLMYKHFLDPRDTNVILPPPREILRTPIPPQISETFRMADEMTQFILGSYDGAAGRINDQMSGIAFARSAVQSNNATFPYIVGLIKAINRVAQVYLDLMSKYYITPRSLPIISPDGKRKHVEINHESTGIYMDFDPNHLHVKVEAGVNFSMQKEISLNTLISLSQSMPNFADFFSKKGLQVLLDNIEIRGIDTLKEKAMEYEKELEQSQMLQQQQIQQQQEISIQKMQKEIQSPTPEQIAMMGLEEKSKIDAANISIKQRDAETKFLELMNRIKNEDIEREIKLAEIDAENTRTAVESAINVSKHIHHDLKGNNPNEKMDTESH